MNEVSKLIDRSIIEVVLDSTVTTIGQNAFRNCSKLTSVTIPDSVTTIGNSAFYDCSSLTSVTIGNGVTTIGSYVCYGLSALASVTVNATTPPTLGTRAFDNTNCKIYVPRRSVQSYKNATNWKTYAGRIQAIPS